MRHLSLLVLALAICACTAGAQSPAGINAGTDSAIKLAPPAPTDTFTVAILADRTTGDDAGLAVLRQAVREVNLLAPDFVLHIGDMIPGYKRDMAEWEADVERVKSILGRLEAPFFPLPGNHDVITGTGNPDDRRGEDLYKKHFGPLYYSFDYRYAHFVFLYTDEKLQSRPTLSAAQLDWLRDDLARTRARHVFMLMHKPMWEYSGGNWEAAEEILKGHPVRAVLAGHFHHYYKSENRDGIQYYVLGVTGGQTFSPEAAGGLEHYCLLSVQPEGYSLALVRPGHVLPDDFVTLEDYKNAEKLRNMPRAQAGVVSSVTSPEQGDVDERVSVLVTNPLKRPVEVTVRGVPRGGWSFTPPLRTLLLGPEGRQRVSLGIRCAHESASPLTVPEVEIEYMYEDEKGRTIPLVLVRRVPLVRTVPLPVLRSGANLDGRADEAVWQKASVLTTTRWQTSPYEGDEPSPTFRSFATSAGLFLYAESQDSRTADFRGDRMLSDAIFVGAMRPTADASAADLASPPVIVIYPFAQPGQDQTMRAFWSARHPTGPAAPEVHVESQVAPGGQGWRCEAFVPWDMLLVDAPRAGEQLRFNVGAWDNDGELFVELHSWTPTDDAGLWGRLTINEPTQGR